MLRNKHPEFIYESFEYELNAKALKIKFHFHLSPNVDFFPTIEIPVPDNLENIDNFVFNLGLTEMISYWKAACSPKIVVRPGSLNNEQITFWKDLFINGLGEFFYINKVDFNDPSLLSIEVAANKKLERSKKNNLTGDLILVGGGKDSAVTAELLAKDHALLLNPTLAAVNIARTAGFKNIILVKRTIDPTLLQLNEQGYLNGHTPFSAYLAFLSATVAYIYKLKNIVVSNEQSAGEANLEYLGLKVNHQYSKSMEFEKVFRKYLGKYLSSDLNYFSFLRPLNELQIAALFMQTEKYDNIFNSCNIGKGASWCGECAKCAFVYLLFSALMPKERVKKIFGERNFFDNEKIKQYVKDLTGSGKHKPLDCVGTEEESRTALNLITNPRDQEILAKIKNDWVNEHFLPEEYGEILKMKMGILKL